MQSSLLAHAAPEHVTTVEGIPADDHHQAHHNDVHHSHHVSDAEASLLFAKATSHSLSKDSTNEGAQVVDYMI